MILSATEASGAYRGDCDGDAGLFAGTGDGTGKRRTTDPALVTRAGRVIGREALAARVAALPSACPGGAVLRDRRRRLRAGGHRSARGLAPPAMPWRCCQPNRRGAPVSPGALLRTQPWRAGRWALAPRAGRGGRPPPHPELALLLGTSGSPAGRGWCASRPKTVTANARAIATYLGLRPKIAPRWSCPLHYSYGLSVPDRASGGGAASGMAARSSMPTISSARPPSAAAAGPACPIPTSCWSKLANPRRGPADPTWFATAAGGRLPPGGSGSVPFCARGACMPLRVRQTGPPRASPICARTRRRPPRPDPGSSPGAALALVDAGRPIAGARGAGL